MRRSRVLPYDWLADATRWMRKPTTFGGIEEALRDCAALYRKDLWRDTGVYVEIWLEKVITHPPFVLGELLIQDSDESR
jgi:hypothetical protein